MINRIAFLVFVAVLTPACSDGAAPDEVATLEANPETTTPAAARESEAAPEVDAEEAFLAFSACLREKGIEIEDPELDSGGGFGMVIGGSDGEMNFEAFEAAQEKCAVHLEGVTMEFEPPDLTELEDELLAFSTCMRNNGVEMDDPDLTNPGGSDDGVVIDPFGGSIDPNDPTFQEAFEACEGILSDFGPGRP